MTNPFTNIRWSDYRSPNTGHLDLEQILLDTGAAPDSPAVWYVQQVQQIRHISSRQVAAHVLIAASAYDAIATTLRD